jgi:hypothetical protein
LPFDSGAIYKNVVTLTTPHLILLASLFIPALTLMGVVWLWRGIRSTQQGHPPIADKLLRSPGESLRREIEKMDEQVNDIFVWTFFGPALVMTIFFVPTPGVKPGHRFDEFRDIRNSDYCDRLRFARLEIDSSD